MHVCTRVALAGLLLGCAATLDPTARMLDALHLRVDAGGQAYGRDELDPLLWEETRYLLEEPAASRALATLDAFLVAHPRGDTRARALLQRDLWAIFDWVAAPQRARSDVGTRLEVRLADAVREQALDCLAIAALPDTLELALVDGLLDVVPDARSLRDPLGPWVVLGDGASPEPLALTHQMTFERSSFVVLIRLPGGRTETLAYLERLAAFAQPMVREGPGNEVNPAVPQFPVGTAFVLLRRALLVDDLGEVVLSPITESVEARIYRQIGAVETRRPPITLGGVQDVFEWRLDGRGLLRAVTPDQQGFVMFQTNGADYFEDHEAGPDHRARILGTCAQCHATELNPGRTAPGLLSVESFARRDRAQAGMPRLTPATLDAQATLSIAWKRRQPTWQRLQSLWSRR